MLQVEGVSRKYGKKQVLRDISFTASQGEIIAIAGANGCGKSTLLSILAGTLLPDSGSFTAFGKDLFRNPKERERLIGYVPQENPLIPELTAKDNLKLWYADSRYDLSEELAGGVLKLLGIPEFLNVRVDRMSGGMKKRLSIGCAVAMDPPVLILDEPSAALDLVCKDDIRRYLEDFRSRKGIVLITTHDEDELRICDRVLVMKEGILSEAPKGTHGEALLNLIR